MLNEPCLLIGELSMYGAPTMRSGLAGAVISAMEEPNKALEEPVSKGLSKDI